MRRARCSAPRRARKARSRRPRRRGPQKSAQLLTDDFPHYVEGVRTTILQPGEVAPDFTLKATPDQSVSLAEFRGRLVILAFYPADWSPVCSDQLAVYNQILDEFRGYGAQLLGISVDGVWCHAAFCRDRELHFPLLADFEPSGEVARAYGPYHAKEGVSKRALFVTDAGVVCACIYLPPIG